MEAYLTIVGIVLYLVVGYVFITILDDRYIDDGILLLIIVGWLPFLVTSLTLTLFSSLVSYSRYLYRKFRS